MVDRCFLSFLVLVIVLFKIKDAKRPTMTAEITYGTARIYHRRFTKTRETVTLSSAEIQVKLKKQRSLEPVMDTKTFSDSDSDETCTPDMKRKNRATQGKQISKKRTCSLKNGEAIEKKMKISTDGKPIHFVNGKDKAHSNWMQYLNCAPKMVNGKDCYQCVFCKIAFTTDVDNVRHLVRTHGKDELSQSDIHVLDEWLIKNEKEEFSTRRKKETRKIHLDKNEQKVSEQGNNNEQMKAVQNISDNNSESTFTCDKKSTRELSFKCDVCDYASNRNSDMKKHMRIHTGEKYFKCDMCDYASTHSGNLNKHMRIHTVEKCLKCDDCDYVCNSNDNLKMHMRIHRVEKLFKCDVCDYACKQSSILKKHMRIHSGEKCFKCNVCEFSCNRSCHLMTHMRIHREEKCFKCDVCGYVSNHSSTLKRHMKIHTGERFFKCDVCDYECMQSSTLKRHVLKHTGEKCFKCNICDYAGNHSSPLKRHMRIHTGEKSFKCGICDHACNQSANLKKHMLIHTGEKCFKCDICDFACNQSGNLKKHMRIHTGEKCFKCDMCGYTCNQSANLKRHISIHIEREMF